MCSIICEYGHVVHRAAEIEGTPLKKAHNAPDGARHIFSNAQKTSNNIEHRAPVSGSQFLIVVLCTIVTVGGGGGVQVLHMYLPPGGKLLNKYT